MFARYFEENFDIARGACICNIGIGAGYWDRYLSYKLNGGNLISIDIDETSCRQLKECLLNERNPNPIRIIHSDVMLVNDLFEQCDIVTLVGSTRMESGFLEGILEKAFSFLKVRGSFYYQSLDKNEARDRIEELCKRKEMRVDDYMLDTNYGFKAQYWKITKP